MAYMYSYTHSHIILTIRVMQIIEGTRLHSWYDQQNDVITVHVCKMTGAYDHNMYQLVTKIRLKMWSTVDREIFVKNKIKSQHKPRKLKQIIHCI